MIVPEPLWHYSPEHPLGSWGADLRLFEHCVLGVFNERHWFCLERATGKLLWSRKSLGRPNIVKGIHGNIFVATEYRCHDGPWGANFGIYGFRLDDQQLLWTSHAPGGWGRFVRLLDFVPDFTNELRDSPLIVHHGQVFTEGGRVLDANTGADVGKGDLPPEVEKLVDTHTVTLLVHKSLDCGELGRLCVGIPEQPEESHVIDVELPVRFHMRHKDGRVLWVFDASQFPEIGEPRYQGLNFRYLAPYLYLLVSDQPLYARETSQPGFPTPNPALFNLWALDVRSGQVVQKVPINRERATGGDIEDGDSRNLLVSFKNPDKEGRYTLLCFKRT